MKFTRDNVMVLTTYTTDSTPLYVRWLIILDGRYYVVESRDRVNGGTGRPAPETAVLPADAHGILVWDDSPEADALFDACVVPGLDHELAIRALIGHLNGEPPLLFAPAAPAPKPEPAKPFNLTDRLREMAANDPAVSDDMFVVLNRAFDGRPILDDTTNPTT